jgi:Tol biopolymer transport system component
MWELFRASAAGGTAEKLATAPLPVSVTRVNWSVNNSLIAFTGLSGGTALPWIIKADGSGAHPVAMAPGLSDQILYPSWYPDGERLAIVDARDLVIKRIDLLGRAAVPVTDRAEVLAGMPRVSPDGRWIAFAGQQNNGQPYQQAQNVVWLVSDAGVLKALEPNPVQGREPAWSPDGKHLAFVSNRASDNGRYAIFIINRDGSGLVQVTNDTLNAQYPGWSPDGRQIVFSGIVPGTDKNRGIAIIDLPKIR